MAQRTQQPSQDASQTLADASAVHDLSFSSVKVAGVECLGSAGSASDTPQAQAQAADVAANRLVPMELTTETDPATAPLGVDCGMPEMCGLDPCLCGVPDAYGRCACNGTKDMPPTLSYQSSDTGVATVEQAFDRVWIVPHGAGDAQVTVTARLDHHRDATYTIPVHVGGPTLVDVGAVSCVTLLVAVIALLVWSVVRRVCARRRVRCGSDG